MQNFVRTWQEHWFVNNLAQIIEVLIFSKITVFFFCTLHLMLTNLEVRHLIQVTESLIFTHLEISIFCAVQETSRHVFNKLQVQNVFFYVARCMTPFIAI